MRVVRCVSAWDWMHAHSGGRWLDVTCMHAWVWARGPSHTPSHPASSTQPPSAKRTGVYMYCLFQRNRCCCTSSSCTTVE